MQNLETVHRNVLCTHSEIPVRAGKGRLAFIDVCDVAAVAAKVLRYPGHVGRGYTLTGPAALSFEDIAGILSDGLGPIQYRPSGVWRFVRDKQAEGMPFGMALGMPFGIALGMPFGMALVMAALYTVQRTGHAAEVTGDVARIPGRAPTDFRSYAQRQKAAWLAI